ncbi:hypothetical protein ACFQEW_24730 [Methylobacterium tardum]|uniref:hypothetical protein n=1 Tax=Methylobacterium tardum TaxID=374432 RepID=UPI001EE05528|nr:hypothetical protein [Methylobacterium tardum]URD38062.1 hypothetical protein M6G65_06155 [Methylobacterium tardum]
MRPAIPSSAGTIDLPAVARSIVIARLLLGMNKYASGCRSRASSLDLNFIAIDLPRTAEVLVVIAPGKSATIC